MKWWALLDLNPNPRKAGDAGEHTFNGFDG